MKIEDARNAAILAHPNWRSDDIENVARGMVARSEWFALLDQLEREATEFNAADAKRHEEFKQSMGEDASGLLGMPGGYGWGSQNPRDDDLWQEIIDSAERHAQRVEAQTGRRPQASDFDYERDVAAPFRKADADLRAKPEDTGPRPATIEDARPTPGSAADIRDRLLAMTVPER